MTGQQITRAVLTNLTSGRELRLQFNPETLSRTKSAQWTELPTNDAQNQPRPQFAGHGSDQLTAKLLFDDSDPQLGGVLGGLTGVDSAIDLLFEWLTITARHAHEHTPAPPTLRFTWGDGVSFKGVLKNVSVQYLRFSPAGKPTRATATVSMQGVPDEPGPTNPTSGGPPGRASAQLRDGDTLATIAYQHYGDPNLWRAIAISNGIEDPARVPIGTRLLLPRRADALALNAAEAGDG